MKLPTELSECPYCYIPLEYEFETYVCLKCGYECEYDEEGNCYIGAFPLEDA